MKHLRCPLAALPLSLALGCGGLPDLEEQVADPSQRSKTSCEDRPDSGYRVVDDMQGDFTLEVVDCGLAFPSRLKFSPDGDLLLLAQLRGTAEAFVRTPDGFVHQPGILHDLGELGVKDEAGLTGVFFGADFDLDAEAVPRRDVFLTYQRVVDGANRNLVRRLTLARTPDGVVATDPVDIVTFPDATGQAHQIQDGVGLTYDDAPHVLIAIGDGNRASAARDPASSNGKLHLLTRDGEAPSGERPWPDHPTVQAIGLRNPYGVLRLPKAVDVRGGIVGVENGNSDADRAWLVRPFPEAGPPAQMDLGHVGDDAASSWTDPTDPHTASALGDERRAVFMTMSPPVSPTSVALHPGGGAIPETRAGAASLVVALFGESGDTDLGPGKSLEWWSLSNIDGAALQADRHPLVERRPETEGEYRHPVAMDVDPASGDIYFADIITGELSRVRAR